MCGRFSITAPKEAVEEMFGVMEVEAFPARYNIAPTQPILVVTVGRPGEPGANHPGRHALLARWGLWPSWVKDPRDFPLLFNARSESAAEKAAFRAAMKYRRVLVPASGFYEWKRAPKGSREKPRAYWVHPRNGGLVAFAGLMETWHSPDGSEIDTAAILTIAANREFASIHDRMPLVIQPENFMRWLDCRAGDAKTVADLVHPVEEGMLEATPVSDLVNKVANTGPEVQSPIGPSEDSGETSESPAESPAQPSLF